MPYSACLSPAICCCTLAIELVSLLTSALYVSVAAAARGRRECGATTWQRTDGARARASVEALGRLVGGEGDGGFTDAVAHLRRAQAGRV